MSSRDQEIIDSLRRGFEAFNRADFDAAMESAHPEIEFVPPGGQGTLRGAAALRAWMEPDAFAEQRIEPREFRINGNKILISQHTWSRGAGSGIEMELDLWADLDAERRRPGDAGRILPSSRGSRGPPSRRAWAWIAALPALRGRPDSSPRAAGAPAAARSAGVERTQDRAPARRDLLHCRPDERIRCGGAERDASFCPPASPDP